MQIDYEIERFDSEDRPYILTLDIEYDASEEEYEGGYYFAGGVEYWSAKVTDINLNPSDKDGEEATVDIKIGSYIKLDDSEIDEVCDYIRKIVSRDNGGRYPCRNYSPDW